ncbi:MAG: M48 family metallopeptidase [Gemmatimonadota bacterium]
MIRRTFAGFAMAVTLSVTACGVSTQQEVNLGAQYAAEINRQLPLVNDAQVVSYINRLGDQIARAGGRGLNYTFYVVNSDVVNAFAVPGGYIYINRGLIERSGNMSEVAGVLAHEIGHVEQRHGVEQMERMQGANLGLNLAYVLLGRRPGSLEQAGVQAVGTAVFAKFSRDDENEADNVAIPLMLASRIHPNGLVTMFQRLMSLRRSSPSALQQWFSTHPTTEERINATRAAISRLPAAQTRNLSSDTQEFQRFRARLRSMAPAPRTATR